LKNILVTGGAGFVGSNFIKMLLGQCDYFVVNLDALTYAGNLDNLKSVSNNPNYEFVKGDIRDRRAVESLFEKYHFDIVVNFAAESHVDRSIVSANEFITTNVVGAHILMEVARNHWLLPDKMNEYQSDVLFIQISTDEVYGSIEVGQFDEESDLKPNSPYSASKASADLIARSYFKTYKFPVIVTRCSNNYVRINIRRR
jgi:dTDP-glucose 4,6-dehydratase